jgi:2-polyprenyl-3-methyl-5-hydroxy-6-metoxy-1,4-benzoquinol methylase
VDLTDRQQREIDYHRERALARADKPLSFSVLKDPHKRWWNAYWSLYAYLLSLDLSGKRVLVLGCGFGEDAMHLAKLGANVYGFDISPESVEIAKRNAQRLSLSIDLAQMPSETMLYPDGFFDCILAVDILHHVDIPKTMSEVRRVAKPGAVFVMDEIYSHSWTESIRRSKLVEQCLYPKMQRLIYDTDRPYITADERKMTEHDIALVKQSFTPVMEKHFNFLVGRVLPAKDLLAMADRVLLSILKPIGWLLAGRVLAAGPIKP